MKPTLKPTPLSYQEFSNLNLREQLLYLCKLGHLAPSTHNTQPWRFYLDEKNRTIKIYVDRKFVLPISDIAGRQTIISVGCLLANIEIGAVTLGCPVTIKTQDLPLQNVVPLSKNKKVPRYVHIADVVLDYEKSSSPRKNVTLFHAIFTRKVVRAEYDSERPISKSLINEICAVADGKNTKLHIISDRVRKMMVAEFQAQADSFVINSSQFSKELGEWLLPNDTESFLGMPGVGFGLRDTQAARIHNGLSGKEKLEAEDGLRFALAGKSGIESSSFIGVVTISEESVLNWVKAGQVFERIFLTLEREGISVAVHAGIVEVGLVNRIFATTSLHTKRKLAVLFRVGWVKNKKDKERPPSPRLPIERVLLAEKL